MAVVEPTTFLEWLFVFSIYVGSSGVLWLFPRIIHKRKDVKFSSMHISHRGGSGEGYENTLRAFKRSIIAGTDMIELDVRLTKDGKVVVIHDEDLFKLTGYAHSVGEANYADIPPIKESIPIEYVSNKRFEETSWAAEDRKVCQLIEVFRRFPEIPINIDIKEHDAELIRKVSELVGTFKRKHITVWGSSNRHTSDLLHKIDPEINIFFCTFKVIFALLLAMVGLLPFIGIRETHFEVFLPLVMKKMLAAKRRLTVSKNLLFSFPKIFMGTSPFSFISHLKARGIHVWFWVCNSEDEYEECIKAGGSGIMTDFPTKLRKFLDDRAKVKTGEKYDEDKVSKKDDTAATATPPS